MLPPYPSFECLGCWQCLGNGGSCCAWYFCEERYLGRRRCAHYGRRGSKRSDEKTEDHCAWTKERKAVSSITYWWLWNGCRRFHAFLLVLHGVWRSRRARAMPFPWTDIDRENSSDTS